MARNSLSPYRGGGLLGGGIDPLFSLHRDMNRLFEDVMGGALPFAGASSGQGGKGQIINAHMNVSETENEIRISAELPGVKEDDIDASLNDDVLTIRGGVVVQLRLRPSSPPSPLAEAARTISARPRAEKRFIRAMRVWISAVWRSGSLETMRSPNDWRRRIWASIRLRA